MLNILLNYACFLHPEFLVERPPVSCGRFWPLVPCAGAFQECWERERMNCRKSIPLAFKRRIDLALSLPKKDKFRSEIRTLQRWKRMRSDGYQRHRSCNVFSELTSSSAFITRLACYRKRSWTVFRIRCRKGLVQKLLRFSHIDGNIVTGNSLTCDLTWFLPVNDKNYLLKFHTMESKLFSY